MMVANEQVDPQVPDVVLVWAQTVEGAIGRDGTMPWHLPEDLAHFKRVTLGTPVVMGRRTWESLPERFRPLPGRENIVVSRDPLYSAPGANVVTSLEAAREQVGLQNRVCVMGGGELYRAALPIATELVVTQISLSVPDADTFAPEIDSTWVLKRETDTEISVSGLAYRFQWYKRQIA